MSPAASSVVDRCPAALAVDAGAVAEALASSAGGVPVQATARPALKTTATASQPLAPTGSLPSPTALAAASVTPGPSARLDPAAGSRVGVHEANLAPKLSHRAKVTLLRH